MDDVAVVTAEIAALHRGRGLRRPDLHIGPGLHAALQLEPRASLDEVRDHLVAALRASATSLPKDLQLVFLNAAALTASDRSLGGRLSHAAAALDRDPRTIRRRLAQANVGVATALVRGTRRPVEMGNAWFIQEFEAITDLRGERPVLTARKIAVPTLGGVHLVKEGFGLPRTSPDRPDPQIRVVEGGHVESISREGESVWSFLVRLDRPTEAGVAREVVLEVTVDSRDGLTPYTAYSAYRACRLVTTTVYFPLDEPPSQVWCHDGVVPVRLADESPAATDRLVVPDENGCVTASFPSPQLGLTYGLHWRWR